VSRRWTEWVASLGDRLPLGLAALLLLLLAGLVGAALYWWPAWLPARWWPRRAPDAAGRRRWRWPRLRRPHLRWRWPWRRRRRTPKEDVAPVESPVAGDELPDLPVEEFLSLADRLAAQGRFAEAVRERLRAIVRALVDARLIEHRPGWTVTELAAAAGAAHPPVRAGLDAASLLFSEIWYGQRPADAGDDARMRGYATQVTGALAGSLAGSHR
jgi:Domain of unknown function (DUF4129)